jgi:transitional endoplasmic reticulum ATPase
MQLWLNQYEHHQKEGLSFLRQKESKKARFHLLKAAEILFKIAEKSEGAFKKKRIAHAQKLLELAQGVLPPHSASSASSPSSASSLSSLSSPSSSVPSLLTFNDIAGLADVKESIFMKVLYPLQYPEKAQKYRVSLGGGILLFGPPGTGKTLIAKAIAGELRQKFFAIYPSEILSKYVGEAEKNCAALFEKCRQEPGSVLFMDEVEALLPARSENQSPVMQRLVPQILSELDGAKTSIGKTLFLAATNEPWSLDPAVMRPGRFDEKIYVGLPDFEARCALFQIHLKDLPLDPTISFQELAERLEGYSGADIHFLCQKTAQHVFLESLKHEGERPLTQKDFLQVISDCRPSVRPELVARFEKYLNQLSSSS